MSASAPRPKRSWPARPASGRKTSSIAPCADHNPASLAVAVGDPGDRGRTHIGNGVYSPGWPKTARSTCAPESSPSPRCSEERRATPPRISASGT